MTQYTKRLIVIVPEASAAEANQWAKGLTGNIADELTFTVGLSPDGRLPMTARVCNWQLMGDERSGLLTAMQKNPNIGAKVYELDHWDPAVARPTLGEVLVLEGLRVVSEDT